MDSNYTEFPLQISARYDLSPASLPSDQDKVKEKEKLSNDSLSSLSSINHQQIRNLGLELEFVENENLTEINISTTEFNSSFAS